MLVRSFLLGLLLPAVVSGAVFAVAWRVWRRRATEGAGVWGSPLALGAGYAAGHAGLAGWPPFPPIEATQWLLYLSLAAALVGLAFGHRRLPAWGRWVLRVSFSLGTPVLLLRPLFEHSWGKVEGALWLLGLGTGILLLWVVLDGLPRGAGGSVLSVVLLITAGGGSAVLVISGSALVGQLGAALAAALGASLVATLLRPAGSLASGVPVVVVLLTSLWIVGYHYVELPAVSGLLLWLGPATAWVRRLEPVGRLSPFKAALVCALPAAILVGAALGVALSASSGESYY